MGAKKKTKQKSGNFNFSDDIGIREIKIKSLGYQNLRVIVKRGKSLWNHQDHSETEFPSICSWIILKSLPELWFLSSSFREVFWSSEWTSP